MFLKVLSDLDGTFKKYFITNKGYVVMDNKYYTIFQKSCIIHTFALTALHNG